MIEIPIDSCKEGKWTVGLNGEYDGSIFFSSKDFEEGKKLIKTAYRHCQLLEMQF